MDNPVAVAVAVAVVVGETVSSFSRIHQGKNRSVEKSERDGIESVARSKSNFIASTNIAIPHSNSHSEAESE